MRNESKFFKIRNIISPLKKRKNIALLTDLREKEIF